MANLSLNPDFPLDQWFDLSQPISKEDQRLVEDQMALYVYKDGLDPSGPEWRSEVGRLRIAVKRHNAKFSHSNSEMLKGAFRRCHTDSNFRTRFVGECRKQK
jgi:hypothetical protein